MIMKKQFIFTLIAILFFTGNIFSQVKVGNNPTVIGTSSVLEIESTNKGVVFPRMTGAQMNAIASPVSGMYVYNTDSLCICQYNGTAWRSMCGGNIGAPHNDWHTTGNSGTSASANFIGTIDGIDFVTRTNNTEKMRVMSGGNVGIGLPNPLANLSVLRSTAAVPATSGTATTAIARFEAQNNVLDIGSNPNSPWGNWIQASAANDLSFKGPLSLNPTGGYVGVGTIAPANRLEVMNDGGTTFNERIALKSYTANPNPLLIIQTGTGTAAAPTNMTVGQNNGAIAFVGHINGGPALLSRVASKYTGDGITNNSEINMVTSAVEHWRLDSIGRIMQAINTSVIPNGPMTSFHMYGDGTSGYTPLGTTLQPNPFAGAEIGFARGGFYSGVGAAIQFIDYNAYSGGLAFLVHKGTQNNSGGVFADNWPLDVIQAMTIVSNGQIGIGTGDPTAKLHIMAGAATASAAPLKFTAGPASQTVLETGAVNYNGSDLTLSDATYAYTLTKTLNGSANLDFPSIAAGAVSNLTITVTGAAVGDPVILGIPNGSVTATATYTAWVSAANTVTVRFSPKATENPAAGVFNVRVVK